MVVRSVANGIHNKLWLTLGGDQLRLFVLPLLKRKIPELQNLAEILQGTQRAKLEKEIYARR